MMYGPDPYTVTDLLRLLKQADSVTHTDHPQHPTVTIRSHGRPGQLSVEAYSVENDQILGQFTITVTPTTEYAEHDTVEAPRPEPCQTHQRVSGERAGGFIPLRIIGELLPQRLEDPPQIARLRVPAVEAAGDGEDLGDGTRAVAVQYLTLRPANQTPVAAE